MRGTNVSTPIKPTSLSGGMTIGVSAGILYGIYSTFVTLGTKSVGGVWSMNSLSLFAVVFILGALASAINDSISAVWAIGITGLRGKLGELRRAISSKPGRIIMLAALIGGPISSSCYLVAIAQAGSIAIPITALCPAIGAVLGRVFLRQPLSLLMGGGVIICVAAGALLGFTADTSAGNIGLGIILALIAALGWGIEGTIGGYSASLIDSGVGIAIRQTTSGLVNFLVLLPILSFLDGNVWRSFELAGLALTDFPNVGFFIVSALAACLSFTLWYRGNALCGTALGMACNGTYSFWGPLLCWLIIGLGFGLQGWELRPIAWIGAVVMVVGIFMIAMGSRRVNS